MKLDIQKWNAVRIEIETEIKALKKVMRAPGHMGSWKEYQTLSELKHRATWHYALRAGVRNRIHCADISVQDAISLLDKYALPTENLAA